LLSFAFGLFTTPAQASSADDLKDKYGEIEEQLLDNVYGIPIYLESSDKKKLMQGDVYGIIYHPFNKVSKALSSISSWCEIMPQHLNIKGCTYEYINNQCRLNLYSGRKKYKKPDNAYRLNYDFNVRSLSDDYFYTMLNADEGPYDTKEYKINVEAIPLSETSTFIHFNYGYQYGFITNIAMKTYLATFGAKKIGFSIKEKDKNNRPVYVGGIQGVIERNAMRYYFAIQSYLNTQEKEKAQRFENRISSWFDLTEQYHKQLYELDKVDYLKYKKMERKDQIRLQKSIKSVPDLVNTCMTNKGA
jgi:hypothetical protein